MPLFDTDSESVSSSNSSSSSRSSKRARLSYINRQRPHRPDPDADYAANVRPAIINMVTRNEPEEGQPPSSSRTMRGLQALLNSSAVSHEDLEDMAKRDDYLMLFDTATLQSQQEEKELCADYHPKDYCFACDAINLECYTKIKEDIEKIIVTHTNHAFHSMTTYTVNAIYEVYETLRRDKNDMIEQLLIKEMKRQNPSEEYINNLELNRVPEWKKSAIYKHYFTADHSLDTEITIPYIIRDMLRQYAQFSKEMFVSHPAAPNKIILKAQLPREAREHAKTITGLYKDFLLLRQMQTGEATKRQKVIGKKPSEIMSGQNVDTKQNVVNSDNNVLLQYFKM